MDKIEKNGLVYNKIIQSNIEFNKIMLNNELYWKKQESIPSDTTPPVYTALRIMGGIRNAADNTYYANSTHNVTIYVNFGEKLFIKPKAKIGTKEWELSSEAPSGTGYMYYKAIHASELEDGLVNFEIYGYADEAGNVGRTLTNADITLSSQSRVIVDKVAPTLNFGNGSISESKLIKVTDDNFNYMTIKNTVSSQTDTIYEKEYELSYENADNLRFDITAYDKANNTSPTRNYFIDNVSPKIIGIAIQNEQDVALENNGTYSKVDLKVSDGSLKTVVITKDSQEVVNEKFNDNYNSAIILKYENSFNEEGLYTVKATDRVGHISQISFTLAKISEIIPLKVVYSTLDFSGTDKTPTKINNIYYYYMKNGDSATFRIQLNKGLLREPTLTIGNINIKLALKTSNENGYIYESKFTISENESELTEGTLNIRLSDVVDKNGNEITDELILNQTKTSNSRSIIYDRTKPVININGDATVELSQGSTYNELGAEVTDNIDATLEIQPSYVNKYTLDGSFIQRVTEVDTNSTGRYNVVYTYTDKAGNQASSKTKIVWVR